jgi:hypothetical protein
LVQFLFKIILETGLLQNVIDANDEMTFKVPIATLVEPRWEERKDETNRVRLRGTETEFHRGAWEAGK